MYIITKKRKEMHYFLVLESFDTERQAVDGIIKILNDEYFSIHSEDRKNIYYKSKNVDVWETYESLAREDLRSTMSCEGIYYGKYFVTPVYS